MTESRPEYITCISDPYRDGAARSLCGRTGPEFRFTSIDHAFMNAKNGGRLLACSACIAVVIDVLSNRQGKSDDEQESDR